jgi:hypothetical protein
MLITVENILDTEYIFGIACEILCSELLVEDFKWY